MKSLRSGDCIGIFSSSSPTNQHALDRLTSYFETKGINVKVAPHTLLSNGYMAGPAEKRAQDFHSLVADPSISCVMTANGGAGAIQMVPLIDYDLIRSNPKIICGLSDPTSILNAITAKTGLATFHGPNGYNFGHKSPSTFTEKNWWRIVEGKTKLPFTFPIGSEIRVLKKPMNMSCFEGQIFGGNLRSLIYLVGSEYMPNLNECVLFIEEIGVQVHDLDALLYHLILSRSVDRLAGLIVGQLVGCTEHDHPNSDSFDDMILRVFGGFDFPIVSNIPLGHTADKITIPIGCRIRVDLSTPNLQLLEVPFD